MKFGGTSVADIDRLRTVAEKLVAARDAGHHVVGVLSAMGDTTDELLDLAHRMSPDPKPRAVDMLISVGERISCALAEMAIEDMGRHAISLTGSQAGIVTDTVHGKATIVDVRAWRVHEALDAGRIVLVAGFQGVSTEREVTTLGRGGSNLTAVALAAALGADACEMYTDVDGVFTADPRVVPQARKLRALTWEQMGALAEAGAQVLQLRSVEHARDHGVRIHVRSSFSGADGTWIVPAGDPLLDGAAVVGVAHRSVDEAVARVTVVGAAEAGRGGGARPARHPGPRGRLGGGGRLVLPRRPRRRRARRALPPRGVRAARRAEAGCRCCVRPGSASSGRPARSARSRWRCSPSEERRTCAPSPPRARPARACPSAPASSSSRRRLPRRSPRESSTSASSRSALRRAASSCRTPCGAVRSRWTSRRPTGSSTASRSSSRR